MRGRAVQRVAPLLSTKEIVAGMPGALLSQVHT